jgi:hypothetical protein
MSEKLIYRIDTTQKYICVDIQSMNSSTVY